MCFLSLGMDETVANHPTIKYSTNKTSCWKAPVTTSMSSDSSSSSSSDDDSSSGSSHGPAIPKGVLKTSTGWQGDSLELEHHRSHHHHHHQRKNEEKAQAAAVDLSQFRNTVVGQGYQAKHVVRQRTANPMDPLKITDMTTATATATKKDTNETDKERRSNKRTRKEAKKSKSSEKKGSKKETRLERYLQCEGLRTFRKELDQY